MNELAPQHRTSSAVCHPFLGKALAALSLMACTAISAQALFTAPVDFRLEKGCRVTRSLGSNSGPHLSAGSVVTALGENSRTEPTHAWVETSNEGKRWLRLSCGRYASEKPPYRDGGAGGGHGQACLPFFDDQNNPVKVGFGGVQDITPPAPRIDNDEFGKAVLQMCGAPGRETGKTEFVLLMKSQPTLLSDLMAYTGGKVFGDRPATTDPDAYLQDLATAWYEVAAFDHIFCGQPGASNGIGGLHYSSRYQQLQSRGEACRLPNLGRNEVVPGVIYTMGARMRNAQGKWVSHETKGYGLTLSATDILMAATRAFAENPTTSTDSKGCLLEVNDGGQRFTTVFVRRRSGIRTFYPDATPNPREDPPCRAALKLNGPT